MWGDLRARRSLRSDLGAVERERLWPVAHSTLVCLGSLGAVDEANRAVASSARVLEETTATKAPTLFDLFLLEFPAPGQ